MNAPTFISGARSSPSPARGNRAYFVIAPTYPQFALDAGVRKFRFALGVCAETALSQRLARVLARAPEARGVADPGSRSRGSGQSRAFYEGQKSRAMLRP
jgi:hypothetical protein